MTMDTKQRFEKLVALHIEGIASVQEENELWKTLKLKTMYWDAFFQARKTDYLLKAFFDAAASEAHFTRRVLNALHPDRLSEKDFIAAVWQKMPKPAPIRRERFFRKSVWKIAASIMLAFGCISLFQKYFIPSVSRQTDVAKVMDSHLVWDVDPVISTLENQLTAYYRPGDIVVYGQPQSRGDIVERIRQMNTQITKMRKRWEHPTAYLIEEKNGEPI